MEQERGAVRPGPARIGVLALQGDFAAHRRALAEAGVEAIEVRGPSALADLDGLVIPGGESTALLRLMRPLDMEDAIRAFHRSGGALFGTCAGAILLAREVRSPEQPGLGLIDITVERNAYGRQIDSFVSRGALRLNGTERPAELVFIRAPRIRETGPAVEILGRHEGEPVLVRDGRVLVATFHPEMSAGHDVHAFFAEMAAARA